MKSFLHQENIEDFKNMHVCLRHFHDEDVERACLFFNPMEPIKRTIPRLH